MTKKADTRWRKVYRRFNLSVIWSILILAFLFTVFYESIVYTTPVGSASIHWRRVPMSGEENSRGPLREGIHLIMPWDIFYTYEVRLLEHMEDYQVLSSDGLHFDMTVRFRWRVLKEHVVGLNQKIGTDYLNRLLIPEIGSIAREVVAGHKATALYSEMRNELQEKIYQTVTNGTSHNHIGDRATESLNKDEYIALQDLLITHVALPESIQAAIEAKLMESEKVQEYAFRVERERLESDRKRVEAQGIAAFQEIVTPAITESYLRWRGIEATLLLAESNNAKIVVIGNSETGLPLILDTRTELSESPEAEKGGKTTGMKLPEALGAALGAEAGAQTPATPPNKGASANTAEPSSASDTTNSQRPNSSSSNAGAPTNNAEGESKNAAG